MSHGNEIQICQNPGRGRFFVRLTDKTVPKLSDIIIVTILRTGGIIREDEQAREAWDELEKSIVANIADDVRVSVLGGSVEMVIEKQMPEILGLDNPSKKLMFEPVTLDQLARVYSYMSRFGESSCQHSAVSMYSHFEKYGDSFCIEQDVLYVLRQNLCDGEYRVYLAPFCASDPKDAYLRILEDARAYGKKVRFETLTGKQKIFVESAFPDLFEAVRCRDMDEYIYSYETMAEFPGKAHARRRTEIRSFWRDFGERTKVTPMCASDLEEVEFLAERWLDLHCKEHNETALRGEKICIERQIEHFDTLGITGTVIRIDGIIKAFCYGVPLNDSCYNVLIEKGSRSFPGIYRVLRQESTRLNVASYSYINFEEDVGDPGLRRLKESYGPAYMIEKYQVRET